MEPLIDKSRIRPSRWWYLPGILVAVLGVAGFLLGLFGNLKKVETKMTRLVTPGEISVDLVKSGKYTLYHEYSSRVDGKIYNSGLILEGLHCIVTNGETRQIVPLKQPFGNITYQLNEIAGRAIYTFRIEHPGKYALMCSVEGRRAEEKVVVALASDKDFDVMRTVVVSLGSVFGGGILGGGVIVLVAVLRNRSLNRLRREANSAIPPTGLQPPFSG